MKNTGLGYLINYLAKRNTYRKTDRGPIPWKRALDGMVHIIKDNLAFKINGRDTPFIDQDYWYAQYTVQCFVIAIVFFHAKAESNVRIQRNINQFCRSRRS